MQDTGLTHVAKVIKEYTPLIFQIGSVFILLLSSFVASRIAPLVEANRNAIQRIEALEAEVASHDPLVRRYSVIDNEVIHIKDNLKDIKESQIRLENKVDRVLGF